MYIYKITQTENTGYDTYNSAIVIAHSIDSAQLIQPQSINIIGTVGKTFDTSKNSAWASCPENVTVQLIGNAIGFSREAVICASFNAG